MTEDYRREAERLRQENASLRDRFSKLCEATLRISEDHDLEGVLRQVIDSARLLTGARYGVLLTFNDSGEIESVAASGLTQDQEQLVCRQPSGLGLLGYLNEVRQPVRIADISRHPGSAGFPGIHPPIKTFLGMQIMNGEELLGNIYLAEKHGGVEFTSEDEETLVMFSSRASREITNARRYQEAQRSRTDLETLFNISPVAIAIFDMKTGKILSYNQEVLRLFGDQETVETSWEENLPRLSFSRFDGREIPPAELPIVRVYQFGETIRAEELIVRMPDGRSIPVLLNGAPIYSEQGDITAAMFAFQDMSSLADTERVRAEFLGLVGEELRMPLTTIKGSVSALSDLDSLSGQTEPQQLLRIIDQQADLMRGQINSLVELTQISTGTLLISQEAVDVSSLLNSAIAEYRSGHGGAAVDAEVPDGIPWVMADRQRIGQVLNNLLVTVARHASETARVKVVASVIDIYVAVSVSSRGPVSTAVDESRLETSRQLLQNVYGSQVRDFRRVAGGENLALGMCKGIVEAHGGRMRVENDAQMGELSITFTLPVADGSLEETDGESLPAAFQDSDITRPFEKGTARVLLAIDDPQALTMVRRVISGAGFDPVAASNPGELGRLLQQEKPDLLIFDRSPYAGGSFRTIQGLPDSVSVPVIVLSAPGDEDGIGRAFDMGADDYIVKPFSPTELIARIKSVLRKRTDNLRTAGISSGYAMGNVSMDYDARTLTVAGSQVALTATEYKLLYELSRNAGRILTQDELLHRVWGSEYVGEPQLLRSYVKSLRQKLGDNARNPSYIFTEHGIGYRMAKP